MTVNAITGTSGSSQSADMIAANSAGQLKDEFLTLMVAQIRNQDPLNPMDGAEYVSQLAQLSTVEGIQNMSHLQSQNNILMNTLQVLEATQLIGKQVTIPTDRITLSNAETLKGRLDPDLPASDVTVKVVSDSGQTVETIKLGRKEAGTVEFELPEIEAGTYRLEVTYQHQGKTYNLTPSIYRPIEKVTVS